MSDMVCIVSLLISIIIVLVLLYYTNKKENMKMKDTKERFDLESITKNISENYKPVNIKLTTYEEEQEENAIISYEELVRQTNNNRINYDTSYVHTESDIDVKKIDLDNDVNSKSVVSNEKSGLTLMSYEKEEEFLKTLRQLQGTLIR